MDKQLCWVWLTTLNGINSAKITSLLDRFDGIEEIYFGQYEDYLDIPLIMQSDIRQLCNKDMQNAVDVINDTIAYGGYVLSYDDENYPKRLKRLVNPPYVLYAKGSYDFSKNSLNIGVVGTRESTQYGELVTEKFCYDLACEGITIVSGMAKGIDAIAARSAIKAGSGTIAVLGNGIDIVYPKENERLMQNIIKYGAVVSEYPIGSPSKPHHFPERNRIIAGLSDGLLVSQAPKRSGALITARYAYDMGIDVYSVPANIFSKNSQGTNNLIKHGAKMVIETSDIIEDFSYVIKDIDKPEHTRVLEPLVKKEKPIKEETSQKKVSINDFKYSGLTEDEKKIIVLLIENEKMSADEIIRQTKIETSKMNAMLSLIEIEGLIKKQAGNFYTLVI